MAMAPRSLSFSHVGLFVRNLEVMTAFYRDVLGFIVTDRGRLANGELVFLSREPREHHQIVLVTGRPEGLPNRIVNQLSFRVGSLAELKALSVEIAATPATELDPILHGTAWSLYFRDPEGNRLELFVDTEWYIPQPCRMPLDLSLPVEAIYAETRAFCERQPGFRPLREWQEDFARKLAARLSETGRA